MKANMKFSFQCSLFHVNWTFGSHDMAIYTPHLCKCLKNKFEKK